MAIAYVTGVTANLGVNGGTTSSVDSTGGTPTGTIAVTATAQRVTQRA